MRRGFIAEVASYLMAFVQRCGIRAGLGLSEVRGPCDGRASAVYAKDQSKSVPLRNMGPTTKRLGA